MLFFVWTFVSIWEKLQYNLWMYTHVRYTHSSSSQTRRRPKVYKFKQNKSYCMSARNTKSPTIDSNHFAFRFIFKLGHFAYLQQLPDVLSSVSRSLHSRLFINFALLSAAALLVIATGKTSRDTADKHGPTCAHPQQEHTCTRSVAQIHCAVQGCRSNQSARVCMGIISYRVRNPGDSCLVTGGGESDGGYGGSVRVPCNCAVCVFVRMPTGLLYHTVSWAAAHTNTHTSMPRYTLYVVCLMLHKCY